MSVYGYARVSTFTQEKNGSSIGDQEARLIEAGVPPENIYRDSFTGTKMSRPQFSILMTKLAPGDKLVVTKLDRFARTAVEGGAIIQQLHEKGITIHILNMGVADKTPMGKLMVTMLLAFAEFERDMIVERTQTGRQVTGKVGGRPQKYTPAKMNLAMELLAAGKSYNEVEQMTGISKSTLVREKAKRKARDATDA